MRENHSQSTNRSHYDRGSSLTSKQRLAGGPCGGKTTALARVFSYLRERGFEVITVPETFTILSSNGMSVDFFSTGGMAKIIQGTVLTVQLTMEDSIERVLRARGKPSVILCDRGTMDGSVYVSKEDFAQVMVEHNTDIVQLRDNRYSGIFHLLTAADGAENFYTLENNQVRHESPEQARDADKNTQKAWLGSPHLYVLDNSTDFEGKMERLVDMYVSYVVAKALLCGPGTHDRVALFCFRTSSCSLLVTQHSIAKIVGLPSNLKRRSAKFLLKGEPDLSQFPQDIDYQVFEVEKVYLQQGNNPGNADNYSFIRRRTNIDSNGRLLGSVYQLTTVHHAGEEWIEQKRIISQREYAAAYMARDRDRHVIRQRRISFLWSQQSFNVHSYVEPVKGLAILHAQVEASPGDADPAVQLPPFLEVDRRLTNSKDDEDKFGAYGISLIDKAIVE